VLATLCQSTCAASAADAGLSGAGGGGTACVAGQATGDAGTLEGNCITCCKNGNSTGFDTFAGDLITSCACTSGASCVDACK
jgi:hypothetical protein